MAVLPLEPFPSRSLYVHMNMPLPPSLTPANAFAQCPPMLRVPNHSNTSREQSGATVSFGARAVSKCVFLSLARVECSFVVAGCCCCSFGLAGDESSCDAEQRTVRVSRGCSGDR